jgi:rare lipoprotein A
MRWRCEEVRWLFLLGGLLLAGCGSTSPDGVGPGGASLGGQYKVGKPYQVGGRWYYPAYDPSYAAVGVASWYGHPFHGRRTANGELYDMEALTAAHPTLPLPSIVRVTNLANQRELLLRVNDRGPFVGERIIDLSHAAARALDFDRRGTTEVRVEFVQLADAGGAPPQPVVRAVAIQPLPEPPAKLAPPSVGVPQLVRVASAQPAGLPATRPSAGDAMDKRCLGGRGFIQVGAFAEPERALRLAKELDAAVALPVSAELPSVDRYARVRLGPIDDRQQAEAALRWLHQIGHANAFLVEPEFTPAVAC